MSRRRVTGDRTVSRFDPNPSPFDPITKYFMLFLFSVFDSVPLRLDYRGAA
jgi:hypothetical protein